MGNYSKAAVRTRAPGAAVERPGDNPGGVLVTGATGFIGMQVLARYLERTTRRVYALVRAEDNDAARIRIQETLERLYGSEHPYGERVVALRGDITAPGLGLGRRGDAVAERVSEIVHGAASVSFSLPLEQARLINVGGTREVLDFAAKCQARGRLRRLSYVSTAYVAGEHVGRFSEDDLDVGQRFRNSYERSKFEAERMVCRARARMPITVLRPSIVVGERGSGFTTSFNVLYWPLRALAGGAYRALPARGDGVVDVVPVDYVADAIFALTAAPEAEGATFNLTAARDASSVGEVLQLACGFFGRQSPLLIDPQLYRHVIHPVLLRTIPSAHQRRTLLRSEVFFPYFAAQGRFDDRRTRVALRGTGVACDPLPTYFAQLVEFALRAEWGKRALSRTTVSPDRPWTDAPTVHSLRRRHAPLRPASALVPAI